MKKHTPTALITGASQGFGLALALALAQNGWRLIINARDARRLRTAQRQLQKHSEVIAISGDLRDEIHLLQFPEIVERKDWIVDLVINNASTIGPSPQPALLEYTVDDLHRIYHTNVIAPISLLQKLKPYLAARASIINVSSDAAVEAYEGWGGYGASKAALDHWTAILAKENPQWQVYAFDPGDMRTGMHQAAFPDEDISDQPLPETVAVPALLRLLDQLPESGRYTAQQWAPQVV
jgi:NAD(P)-dependent dehydrogenase (short-subunit alcohol dehydrogenase family)